MSCDPVALEAKLNEAENALGRAMRAARKSDFPKVWKEADSAIALTLAAKTMCHDEVPHEHPTPTPTPPPPPTPEPTPTPTPTPPPAPSPLPAEPSGFYPAHEFTEEEWLKVTRASGVPDMVGQTATGLGEDTSAWRLKLRPSGFLCYDDPVLFFGKPGAAHLHHGFTVAFDAFTSHDTLMNGSHNPRVLGGPLYHSNIFAPAMINEARQEVVNLWGGDLYYKVHPPGHPSLYGDDVQNVPKGLMFVAKGGNFTLGEPYDEGRNTRFHTGENPTLEAMIAEWDAKHDPTGATKTPIPAGYVVRVGLAHPNCWDGQNTFLPGSVHLAERIRNQSTDWKPRAPASHPIVIPTPHPIPFYQLLEDDEVRHWRLSSDAPGTAAGSSVHWDYIEAINDRVRDGMMEVFREHRTSSGGALGLTGRSLIQPAGDGSPPRLPIPPRPSGDHAGHVM